MAAKKAKKRAIEARVGHSYGDWAGYDGVNYSESVEISKQLNRRGIPQTKTIKKNSKDASDYDIAHDYLISVNEKASMGYKKKGKK